MLERYVSRLVALHEDLVDYLWATASGQAEHKRLLCRRPKGLDAV